MSDLHAELAQLSSEERNYLLRHLPLGLKEMNDWATLFQFVDEGDFFVAKANYLDTHSELAQDIRDYALEAAVEQQDWLRFSHYALLTINLDSIRESLATASILRGLMVSERQTLAIDIANKLPDWLQRVRARAVVISCLPASKIADDQLTELLADLQGAPPPTDEPTALAWHETLASMIESLGGQIYDVLTSYLQRLQPWSQLHDDLWLRLATKVRQNGRYWEALASIQDQSLLTTRLPSLVCLQAPEEIEPFFVGLCHLAQGNRVLFWHTAIIALGQIGCFAFPQALHHWQTNQLSIPAPWSPQFILLGQPFFQQLSDTAPTALPTNNLANDCKMTLHCLLLPANAAWPDIEQALLDLETMTEGAIALHLSLHLLSKSKMLSEHQQHDILLTIGQTLHAVDYAAPIADCCRFLDLMARYWPTRLPLVLDQIVLTARVSQERLLELAEGVTETAVLTHFLQQANPFTATTAPNSGQGFLLRQQLLLIVLTKLCQQNGDPAFLTKAVTQFLLPDERDLLRERVALGLGAAGQIKAAQAIADKIDDSRQKLLTCLNLALGQNGRSVDQTDVRHLLEFSSLYHAFANVAPLEDERLALTVLLERPNEPEELVQNRLIQISEQDRQATALIDLAHHHILFQERELPDTQRDYKRAINLLEEAINLIDAEERLLSLTPELAILAGRLGKREGAAEFYEAVKQTLLLTELPWSRRLETLYYLLPQIEPILLSPEKLKSPQRSMEAIKATAHLFNSLIALPDDPALVPVAEQLRTEWHIVFSLIISTLERIPHSAPSVIYNYIRWPWRLRLALTQPLLFKLILWEPVNRLIWRLRHALPDQITTRLRPKWLAQWGYSLAMDR